MHKSLTSTLAGAKPTDEDIQAIVTFFGSLPAPPNPHVDKGGSISQAAQRGKTVFHSKVAGCAECHSGPHWTDGEIHDVGTGRRDDKYKGYNTPSLHNAYRRAEYLHDGRADTLEELLSGPHAPAKVTGEGELSAAQRRDLIEFLKTL